ncbi:MAG: hypothetical protein HQK51_00470 [Oligoflexia bacterium]|nr:hypothetical protein [Oligoflexia bacterium]
MKQKLKKIKKIKNNNSPKNRIVSVKTEELATLKKSLDNLIGNMETELSRVKKLHTQHVPLRFEKFKGLQIISKYKTGDQNGGEFFDLINNNNKLFMILSSSSSYLSSSCVVDSFLKLSEHSNLNYQKSDTFIKILNNELINNIKESLKPKYRGDKFIPPNTNVKHSVEIITAEIDLKTLTMEGINLGTTLLFSKEMESYFDKNEIQLPISNISNISNNNRNDELDNIDQILNTYRFKIKFKRGERLLLLSPGFRKNTKDILDDTHISDFIKIHNNKILSDLINELFFHLKKYNDYNMSNNYPIYDSSSIIIEVNENVITEV